MISKSATMHLLANSCKWTALAVVACILTLSRAAAQPAAAAMGERGPREMTGAGETPRLVAQNMLGDDNWATNFTLNGTDAEVLAVANDGSGNLYAGGRFTVAGSTIANHVAKWDGTGWSPLAGGVTSAPNDTSIWSLAVDSSNNLYAGGRFAYAGGTAANNIAKWNGTTWQALGTGLAGCTPVPTCNPVVSALAVDPSGNVYAGGNFITAGGVTVNGIAKWNGSNWQALGSGVSGGLAWVNSLALDNSGNLFAGGNFVTAGGTTVNNVAEWNGSSWQALSTGTSGADPGIYALEVDGSNNVYAGGAFTSIGSVSTSRIAKWNGSNWQALGSPIPPASAYYCRIASLAVYGTTLYAGGYFNSSNCSSGEEYVAAWNGSSWSALGNGTNNQVNALTVDSGGSLDAGGTFTGAGSVSANHVARWSTSSWAGLGTDASVNSQVLALAIGGGSVYAGGGFTWAGGVSTTAITKLNGSSWSAVGSGGGMSGPSSSTPSVSALVRDAGGNVYAGGSFTGAGGVSANYIAEWNGSNWQALGSGTNNAVLALALDNSGNPYAGGVFTQAGSTAANCIAKWENNNWTALGNGVSCGPNGKGGYYSVSAIAVDGLGNVYAGGSFTNAGGASASNIAKWNGSSWSALGSGTNGPVSALAFDGGGNLYAGGAFTTAGGVSANNIARWNGSSWSALGSGSSGQVSALVFDGIGNLFVGGAFALAGGASANNIAKWNGSAWRVLGSGINGGVSSLALDGAGNLYAGGAFSTAGGKASANFARYAIVPAVSGFSRLGIKNSPFAFSASDFASNFLEGSGSALVKIEILALPAHGTLKLSGNAVSLNQEIGAVDLGNLAFTPDTDWLGTTSIGWNGSDGTQYAPSGASITMNVVIPKMYYFPTISSIHN